jgi:Do/DeqQ family serine protease
MKFYRAFAFVFTSVATGLAAAFLLVLLRPDLVAPGSVSSRPIVTVSPGVDSYAEAVAATAPAVISVVASKLTRERRNPLFDDPFFRRFFDGGEEQPTVRRESSLGSGVIVDPNGYVLTNHHVIEGASEIRLALGDGREVPARIVGVDPDTDLAVLQAGGETRLPVARLGRSEDLRVGDVVLAIGNPFAVGQTVTMGIVSATGRDKLGITNFENFIQTDAAINPGNSGGALVNTHGEIVGINTAIFSRSGGSHGIGFAIPAQIARTVMAEIIRHGRVIRGWLGITGQDLSAPLAESLGLLDVRGILVSGVLQEGPADSAGIAAGDVITAIEGQPIAASADLLNRVAAYKPGTEVAIEVLREKMPLTLRVRIDERPRAVSP